MVSEAEAFVRQQHLPQSDLNVENKTHLCQQVVLNKGPWNTAPCTQ